MVTDDFLRSLCYGTCLFTIQSVRNQNSIDTAMTLRAVIHVGKRLRALVITLLNWNVDGERFLQ